MICLHLSSTYNKLACFPNLYLSKMIFMSLIVTFSEEYLRNIWDGDFWIWGTLTAFCGSASLYCFNLSIFKHKFKSEIKGDSQTKKPKTCIIKGFPYFWIFLPFFILEVMYTKIYQKEYCYHALNISTNLNAFKKFYYVKQIHIQIYKYFFPLQKEGWDIKVES